MLPETKVYRGDVLTIVGSVANVQRGIESIGVADRATDVDGHAGRRRGHRCRSIDRPSGAAYRQRRDWPQPAGGCPSGRLGLWMVALGQAARVRPYPRSTLWVFESIGLTGFVAVVGLNAGPDFIRGLADERPGLVVAGALTITIPLLLGVLVGRRLFKLHPGVLLGVCAGACTATPALAAVQETAKSAVPSIGYGVAYAVGNVLLAIWGTIIVAMVA